ncbi:hypothetical protein FRB90_012022 [Tulasnella sp. 427]|nr:hypothetical protein FRB90_012022 [Tulasnella sp. 427]
MSTDAQTMRVPSLVGGVPTKADFVPSILFSIAYGLSLIPFIRRFLNKETRVWTLAMGVLPFSIERNLSKGKLVYQQVSFALGYISFASDCVAFMRAVMVNTTLADPHRGSVDQPRRRYWYRRVADVAGFLWLVSTVPGIVGYSKMPGSGEHQDQADQLYRLRYASTAAALFLFIAWFVVLQTIRRRIQWLDRRAIDWVCFILAFNCIVPIYRLVVMHYTTTFLNVLPSSDPLYPSSSLTTSASKATFYIFHSLPELVLAWTIQSMNMRAVFNTGPFGDWRGSDKAPGAPQLRQNGLYIDGVGVPKQTNWSGKKNTSGQGEKKKETSWASKAFGLGLLRRKSSERSEDATVVGRPSDVAGTV